MRRRSALALVAAAPALAPGGARAQGTRVIKAVGPANDSYRAIHYAVRSGIFTRYGLAVEATIVANGAAAAAALIGGAADIALVNVVTLFQAHLRGVAMTALSPIVLVDSDKPTTLTLVLKDSPLRSARDLTGKTLGSPGLNDIASVSTRAWIDQNGGDSKAVRFVEIGTSTAVPVLEQGRVDAVTVNEPLAGQALSSGKVRVLAHPLDAIGKRYQAGAFAVMEPVVVKNADLMSRLARGIRDAALYANAHLAETVDLVSSYSGVAPEVIANMTRTIDPEFVEVRNLQPVIDMLARYGALDRSFPAEEIISSAALKPRR